MTAQETNVVNGISTTLANTMAAGATSFVVTSATGFPAVPFYVVVDPDTPAKREYMLVDSSIVGTTCTLSAAGKRNLSGSVGDVEHLAGVTVRVSPPMRQLFDDVHDRVDAHLADSADAHAASAISYAGGSGMSATDVEAAIDELAVALDLGGVTQVGKSAPQSVNNTTETAVTFNEEDFDDASQHDGVNTDRVTVASTGVYEVSAQLTWESGSAAGSRIATIKRGATAIVSNNLGAVAASYTTQVIPPFTVSLTSGDIVRLYAYQDSGGAINVSGDSTTERVTYLRVKQVG